jgi:hypothetical protein
MLPSQPPVTSDNFRPRYFATISTNSDPLASSDYHSLRVNLSRRFTHGFGFQFAYTRAHSIDNSARDIGSTESLTNRLPLRNANGTVALPSLATINAVLAQQELAPFTSDADAASYFVHNFVSGPQFDAGRGNSEFDIRHSAVLNFIYELPFGTGHALGGGSKAIVKYAISGWQATGILRFQTGPPFSLLAGVDVNGDGNADDRAAPLSGRLPTLVNPGGAKDSNTQFLSLAGRSQLGVSPTPDVRDRFYLRTSFCGPGIVNTDFSLFKNTRIHERVNVQLRAESFNLFSHTDFRQSSEQHLEPRLWQAAEYAGAGARGPARIEGPVLNAGKRRRLVAAHVSEIRHHGERLPAAASASCPRTATDDLTALSIEQAAALIRKRAVSPLDLTYACLRRIELHNPVLNAFITVTGEAALPQAHQAEEDIQRGRWQGPLPGIPVALKDNMDTAGIRTAAASAVFADRIPSEDSEVARRSKRPAPS